MLLNDLAAIIRAADIHVTEAAGWQGHNHGPMVSVECIVIHHTAGAPTGDYPSFSVVRNGRPGLEGPLAQVGIGRTGRAITFSNGVAWHAGATLQTWMSNPYSIGFEVESAGDGTPWPSVQLYNTAKAAAACCRRYGVPVSRVLGHKEICYPVGRKPDPVGIPGGMPAFRALVQKYLSGDVMDANQYAVLVETQRRVTTARDVAINNQARINAVNAAVDTLEPKVAALQAAVDAGRAVDVETQRRLTELATKVDSIQPGTVNVDVDAFVAQLAPVLGEVLANLFDRRARDGDPNTGPVS